MKNFFYDDKIKLYQKDINGSFQIFERNNIFMNISKLREMKNFKNLENYCTQINEWYMPINVLDHVIKHFPGDSNYKKLIFIEDLLDFKNKKYSYIIYSYSDDRYKINRQKSKLNLFFIQIIKDSELFEICITESIKIGKKTTHKLNQINTYYKVDTFREDRIDRIKNSKIESSYFKDECDQYELFQLTRDERFKIEKSINLFEKEKNHFAVELLKITDQESIDINLNIKEKGSCIDKNLINEKEIFSNMFIENTQKISSSDIYEFFKEKDGNITIKELLDLYETDKLPFHSNKSYTINKIMKIISYKKFSSSYFALNFMFNENTNKIDCKKIVFNENDLISVIKEIEADIYKINLEFGYEIFSMEETFLKCLINFKV